MEDCCVIIYLLFADARQKPGLPGAPAGLPMLLGPFLRGHMKTVKIFVIGTSCSGKTMIARSIEYMLKFCGFLNVTVQDSDPDPAPEIREASLHRLASSGVQVDITVATVLR
jgi:hypothetical protein